MVEELPVVDLSPFLVGEGWVVGEPPTPSQQSVASTIHHACTHHGFLFLTSLLPPAARERLFESAHSVFSLPEERKRRDLTRVSPHTNMGYSPLATESLNLNRPPENKEAFNVRSPRAHSNCFDGCPPGFGERLLEFWETVEHASIRYAMACSLALGLPHDFFSSTLQSLNQCTVRLLHYPPCDEHAGSVPPDETKASGKLPPIRVGEHTDFGLFTFLLLGEGAEGLQLKPVAGGEIGGKSSGEAGGWLDVKVPAAARDGAVVNTGALLARWTNDVWRATAHRVIVPNADVASRDRYSIACFIDPDETAVIEVHPKFVPEGEEPRYTRTTGLEYLTMKLREAQSVGGK